MGQRILMGILLSSGTISITQTFYYDQRCDIVTYMFDIGGYLEHLNKNIASMRDARNNIGLQTQIYISTTVCVIVLRQQITNWETVMPTDDLLLGWEGFLVIVVQLENSFVSPGSNKLRPRLCPCSCYP